MPKSKHVKREEAAERQVAREARGDEGQLARLVSWGQGHNKEAARLRERLGIEKEEGS